MTFVPRMGGRAEGREEKKTPATHEVLGERAKQNIRGEKKTVSMRIGLGKKKLKIGWPNEEKLPSQKKEKQP